MAAIVYPAGLPAPQSMTAQPTERRRMKGRPGPWQAGPGGRERAEVEPLTWVLSPQEAQTFRTWWADTLVHGGAWWAATWPSSRGPVAVARRFASPPRWQALGGGVWRVSAECLTRGGATLPTDGA